MVESPELTLFTNPRSRGSIARWMLEEVGVPYGVEILPFGPAMKVPAYLELNPMGKVPTLRHGNEIVTETGAICAYLADAFPDCRLAPPPKHRASYYRWLFFASGPVDSSLTSAILGLELPEQGRGMLGYGPLTVVLDVIRSALTKADYLCGSDCTAADVYLGAMLGFGIEVRAFEPDPVIRAYCERLAGRPAFARARAKDAEAAEALEKMAAQNA